eukprot:5599494-Pleurochrysis_carterae.AAC.4
MKTQSAWRRRTPVRSCRRNCAVAARLLGSACAPAASGRQRSGEATERKAPRYYVKSSVSRTAVQLGSFITAISRALITI